MAGLLFAVADSHATAAGWLANRNGLLSLVCGLGVLHLHLSWRRKGSPRFLAFALLLFAVGLGCGEAAIATLAYLSAWQLTQEEGSWPQRILPLAPYAAIAVLWRILYVSLGFGTRGTSLYLDPGSQPLVFLQALAERAPLLTAGQWVKLPVDLWMILPRDAQLAASALAALLVLGVLGLLWDLLRRDVLARFWALGMAFSLVPISAVLPMDRLLLFAGLGAFGLMAALCESTGVWPRDRARAPGWRRRVAWLLLVLHGPLAAMLLVARISTLPAILFIDSSFARQAPQGPEVAGQTFVFVNGAEFPVAYFRLMRTAPGDGPAPRRVTQLGALTTAHTVRRVDERSLVMRAEDGFLAHTIDRLLWDRDRRFTIGERIERPEFTAEILSLTRDDRPLEVAFHFRSALEDPGLRWLYWQDGRLIPFPLPALGETMSVEPGF